MAAEGQAAALARQWRAPRQELIGQSPCMRRLGLKIRAAGRRDCTVLVQGESGSGKEIVARHIHAASARADGPFVPVDCATLQDSLAESQLFGHLEGSFTGARQSTLGLFRSAEGGTLFLDEIGELRPSVQARLLRCIQDSAVVPVGGVGAIAVDTRIIAATHRDLDAMTREGSFREDLLYRINVVRMFVPPLRERRQDIGDLVAHFLSLLARVYREPVKTISPAALEALEAYDWPGNIRQLRNAIEHAHVFTDGPSIDLPALPSPPRDAPPTAPAATAEGPLIPLAAAEQDLIARALRATSGNQSQAARILRIHRRRLHRKIIRYGLDSLI